MGCFAFMPVVLLVATVDEPAVLVRGVPDLGSEEAAAFAALYLAGENPRPGTPRSHRHMPPPSHSPPLLPTAAHQTLPQLRSVWPAFCFD